MQRGRVAFIDFYGEEVVLDLPARKVYWYCFLLFVPFPLYTLCWWYILYCTLPEAVLQGSSLIHQWANRIFHFCSQKDEPLFGPHLVYRLGMRVQNSSLWRWVLFDTLEMTNHQPQTGLLPCFTLPNFWKTVGVLPVVTASSSYFQRFSSASDLLSHWTV